MSPDFWTRRDFLAASAAGAALASSPLTTRAATSPNERLRLGFIGVGGRARQILDAAFRLERDDKVLEIAAVCDVFNRYRHDVATNIERQVGHKPKTAVDYREVLDDDSIDAVVIATPDHWHAKQTIDALERGKHVYCEKPMTHTVEEALAVHKAWRDSGLVMQVGVQSTSLPVWKAINERICAGDLGKILQYQTEFFRNSDVGQWRYYELTKDMTPENIEWDMFLGTEFGLAPEMPFDRAKFAQWRCYWEFGAGMFTDLFVHRTTSMLKATGLRFPGRVVGAGGIFLEYDGRTVPDVATVVADFDEGVQGLVTATMCNSETPLRQTIRGHHGSIVLGTGDGFSDYDFVAERRPVTHDRTLEDERVEVGSIENTTLAHLRNFATSSLAGDPAGVHCSPELGAAAMAVIKLGARSYREGKVYHFDRESMSYGEGGADWARRWEEKSANRAKPNHVPGWHAGDRGSLLHPPDYQKLAGPWVDGVDPAVGG